MRFHNYMNSKFSFIFELLPLLPCHIPLVIGRFPSFCQITWGVGVPIAEQCSRILSRSFTTTGPIGVDCAPEIDQIKLGMSPTYPITQSRIEVEFIRTEGTYLPKIHGYVSHRLTFIKLLLIIFGGLQQQEKWICISCNGLL